jgi:hypothetical protein
VVPVRESAFFIDSVTVQPMTKGVGQMFPDGLQGSTPVFPLPMEHDAVHSAYDFNVEKPESQFVEFLQFIECQGSPP